MARKAIDATERLERQALAHSLKKLFRSKSLRPDEAVADALAISREHVKAGRFFKRLRGGHAAAISGTDYDLQAVIARLREIAWIRPATEIAGATLWPFLRGELTPNISVSDLVDHHLARLNYTRVGMGEDLRRHLVAAHAKKPILEIVFPVPAVTNPRLREIPNFLESTVAVVDKLTIAGLLYVEAYLGGYLYKAKQLEGHIREFRDSRAFEDAFGPATQDVWAEIRNRLFRGQLLAAYGQRSTAFESRTSVDRILFPIDAAEEFLDAVANEMIVDPQQR